MNHISMTPFGPRPVTAGLLAAEQTARAAAPLPRVDKWEVFRQLCTARARFGLTDRDLTVLNALLSFYQGPSLSDNASLVVFPSNRALSDRAHGMPESTLRRHLAALVASGIVCRRDSPNGKRYAHKSRSGDVVRAYGFDLRPLLTRAEEIAEAAHETEEALQRIRLLRHEVTTMKRDALKLAEYGQDAGLKGDWASLLADLFEVHKAMRRKLSEQDLSQQAGIVRKLLTSIQALVFINTEEMSGSDVENERQFQNSNKDLSDLEPCLEKQKGTASSAPHCPEVAIPLDLVRKACPDMRPYAEADLRDWGDFIRTADIVRGMMGISPDGYAEACKTMGRASAAVAVACIMQRLDKIQSPGGYLRALSRKASDQAFSVGPMVMALVKSGTS